MQYFLNGYRGKAASFSMSRCIYLGDLDASDFLRKHPWPGRAISDTFDDATHRKGNITKRFLSAMKIICGKTGDEDQDMYDDADQEDDRVLFDVTDVGESGAPFYWTQVLQQSFREELEK
jgi:phosphatidylinositol 4-kinase type 2